MIENKLSYLLEVIRRAAGECWKSKLVTYDIAKRYAPLCVWIVEELGYVPRLFNDRIEQRIRETDGKDILDEDFWANEDMIIALFEYLEHELIEDFENVSA